MSFAFTGIEIKSLTPENLKNVCGAARRFGLKAIGLMNSEWLKYQYLDHSDWGVPPVDEESRRYMEDRCRLIREASEYIHEQGLEFYLWRRELRLPVGFIEKYGMDWVNFSNPQVWELVRWNLNRMFDQWPLLDGLILTCTGEEKPGEWITADGVGGELPMADRFEKMFRTVKETCDARNRKVIFRNHGVAYPGIRGEGGEYMLAFQEAARRIGPDMVIMGKCVEEDFQATYPYNMLVSSMAARQPTVMELALPMEYNGVGLVPFPVVEQTAYLLRCAREAGCHGVLARYDWYMTEHQYERTWSIFDTLNEISGYAFGRCVNEPGADPDAITLDYCVERYGSAAAPVAAKIYSNLFIAGCLKQYEPGGRSAQTPTGYPTRPERQLGMLRHTPPHKWTLSPYDYSLNRKALDPDENYIEMMAEEKDRAERIYRKASNLLQQHRALFSPADAEQLESGLLRAREETAIRKHYLIAFFAWLAFERHGDARFRRQSLDALDAADPLIAAYRATYDARELDPELKDGCCYGRGCANSAAALRALLADTSAFYEKYGASGEGCSWSCAHPDTLVFTSGGVSLALDFAGIRLQSVSRNGAELLREPCKLIDIFNGGLHILPKRYSYLRHRSYRVEPKKLRLDIYFGYGGLVLSAVIDEENATANLAIAASTLPATAKVVLPDFQCLFGSNA